MTKTIKKNEVTRDGSNDVKAILIKIDEGDNVLILRSEVNRGD